MNTTKAEILHLLQELQLEQEDNIRLKQYIDSNNFAPVIALLRSKRSMLLFKLHASQKAVDDLDLLVYQIKKIETERKNEK